MHIASRSHGGWQSWRKHSCAQVVLLSRFCHVAYGRCSLFLCLKYSLEPNCHGRCHIHVISHICLQALSPHYAYYYFRDNHHLGWVQCSGLFLAITGTCLLFLQQQPAVPQHLQQFGLCWACFVVLLLLLLLLLPLLDLLAARCYCCCGVASEASHTGWSQCVATTGTEATYADLGHFNRLAIRVSATLRSSTFMLCSC